MDLQESKLFDLDLGAKVPRPQGQGHMKCCLVPSTTCDLCTNKIWSCYFQNIMRRCVFKKIDFWSLILTLGSRSHETSPSTLDIMWPMYRQNLKLLLWKVYEEMHLQENTLFDLWPGVKVTRNITKYPLHHVIYAPTKFEVATSNGLVEDTITRNVTDGRTDGQTDGQTHGRTTDRLWYEINIPYFSYEKAGIIMIKII